MKILYVEYIYDRRAELVLLEDHTVRVIYDGAVISESGGETWLNLDGIYKIYLEFCVEEFFKERERREEQEQFYKDAGRLGWIDIS